MRGALRIVLLIARESRPRPLPEQARLPPAGEAQLRARALGDPTRFRIFRYVADADRAVGVAEVTEAAGLNHNAVRQHLAKLRDAGLVDEQVEVAHGPGRPRLTYRAIPGAAADIGLDSPYEWLAVQLADAVRHRSTAREAGRTAGRTVAAQRLARGAGAAEEGVELVEAEMARHGFRPAVRDTANGVELVLEHCPFAAAASKDPATICQLHLGLAEGIAEATTGVEVDGLRAYEPHQAGCILRLRHRDG